jgi:hypothetical protein
LVIELAKVTVAVNVRYIERIAEKELAAVIVSRKVLLALLAIEEASTIVPEIVLYAVQI